MMNSNIDLHTLTFDESVVHLVKEDFARKKILIPISYYPDETGCILVAMSDPDDFMAMEEVRIITGYEIEVICAEKTQILAQIDRFFNRQSVMEAAEQYRKEHGQDLETEKKEERITDQETDSQAARIVTSIMERAVRMRASDIHFEPMRDRVRVRCRVDGDLLETVTCDHNIYNAVITRIKVLSNIDISGKRKPQDGRILLEVDQREYDVRVSSIPTIHGEKIVMRLNAKEYHARDKRQLGMSKEDIEVFDEILSRPHGIVLVTGPTGSGKTTTMYTALSECNRERVNIVTVEDPVEAQMDGLNQIQTNEKADLTFASALRAIMRQDPDIIMIGEIRDIETAEIAVRASITGHLVLSTLHTNSTETSISRLLNMGVKSYMIADALTGVIAQRLVRRLCTCKIHRQATAEEKQLLGVQTEETLIICDPVGCSRCANTGYYDRVGIYEIMKITPDIRQAIVKMIPTSRIRELALKEGMRSLHSNAVQLVKDGVTALEEIQKIIYEGD